MPRPMKRIGIILIVFLPMTLFVYGARGLFVFIDIPPHIGDGNFKNVSRSSGPFVMNGYQITFDTFDLAQDFERRVTLARLPQIGSSGKLYFVIEDSKKPFEFGEGRHKRSFGKVSIELRDSCGKLVANVGGSIAELAWSGSGRSHQLNLSSYPYHNVFAPDRNESYSLTIIYKGDPSLETLKGFAAIQCGGSK